MTQSSGAPSGGAAGESASAGAPSREVDAGSSLTDPHAEERRTVSEEYCAACDGSKDCGAKMETEWFATLPDVCWDEWLASVRCSEDNGCGPISGGLLGMGACLAEREALDACLAEFTIGGKISGTASSCFWNRLPSATGCEVNCDDPVRAYGTVCNGPPGGPFSCWCSLNGRDLSDALVLNGPRFFASTCGEAGQVVADGYCSQFVACCYEFLGVLQEGMPEQQLCECTSDPGAGKFASCEALAASMKEGRVVDLCPAYEPQASVPPQP